MEDFKISSGVLMPMPSTKQKGVCKYPFAEMAVNDSFGVALSDMRPAAKRKAALAMRANVTAWCKNTDCLWKFSIRTLEEETRIWRIS